jgi:hypothetical protein
MVAARAETGFVQKSLSRRYVPNGKAFVLIEGEQVVVVDHGTLWASKPTILLAGANVENASRRNKLGILLTVAPDSKAALVDPTEWSVPIITTPAKAPPGIAILGLPHILIQPPGQAPGFDASYGMPSPPIVSHISLPR